MNIIHKIRIKVIIPDWIWIGIKVLIASWAISVDALTVLEWGTVGNIPLIKWGLTVFQDINSGGTWGIAIAIGLAFMMYSTRMDKLQKHFGISVFSFLFSVGMVIGESYAELGNWNYLFHGNLQMGLALLVILGYYFFLKNIIILVITSSGHFSNWFRTNTKNKVESAFFEKHTFALPLVFFLICGLPYMIFFFPGTLSWDALGQLHSALGDGNISGWHPITTTRIMGKCIIIGREIFHSDSIGVFLYTGTQYICQWVIFAYGMFTLSRLKTPIRLRWVAMFYLGLFPIWQNWGLTMVKDTAYYLLIFLLVSLLINVAIYVKEQIKIPNMQKVMLIITAVGIVLYRKEGRYIIILSMLAGILMYRKNWKLWVSAAVFSALAIFIVEDVYMVRLQIEEGPIRESMSIPIQQTARYIRDYGDEVTEEEREILSSVFTEDIVNLGALYNPEVSDPTKALFMYDPTEEDLQRYYSVWFGQFLKHPDAYIQAFLNQTYGYFYPDKVNFWDDMGIYYIGNKQHWVDEYIDIEFAVQNRGMRDTFQEISDIVGRMPFVGMFYNSGFQMYILVGCALYLLKGKRKKELFILMPCIGVGLICFLSPVNAYIRYMLPIMACMPLNIGWCYYVKNQDCTISLNTHFQ